jgi:hypothetical protein
MEAGYQVVRETEFDELLAEVMGSILRGDEFIGDVEGILARDPRAGHPMAGNVWCFEKRDAGSDPLSIAYTFNEASREVYLLRMIRRSHDDVAAL